MAFVLEYHGSTRSWDWKKTLKSPGPGVPSKAVSQLMDSWTRLRPTKELPDADTLAPIWAATKDATT